jgi:hypothetical protein
LIVEYSGESQLGRHIICTSKFSVKPGHYSIEVTQPGEGDEWASQATVAPGTCAVIFQTTRTSGFPAIVTIGVAEASLSKIMHLTATCGPAQSCVPLCELQPIASFTGTVTKYYFTHPDVFHSLMGGQFGLHDPTPCLDFGNHGGGGTLDFALD